MDAKKTLTCVCGVVMFIISFTCYAVVMGVGWSLQQMLPMAVPLVTVAAIVSSIPALAVAAYIWLLCVFNKSCDEGGFFCLFIVEMLAGVIEIIGGILFIAAGATTNDPTVLARGVPAGVFALIAGVTYIVCQAFFLGRYKLSEDSTPSS